METPISPAQLEDAKKLHELSIDKSKNWAETKEAFAQFLAARDAEHERRFAERGNELDLARQERDEAQRAVAELRTVQGAWHSVFGSSQLTHASDNFESAKRRADRAEAALQDMTQQRDEFRTEANSSADLLNEALENLAVVTKERDAAREQITKLNSECLRLTEENERLDRDPGRTMRAVDDEEVLRAKIRLESQSYGAEYEVLARALRAKTSEISAFAKELGCLDNPVSVMAAITAKTAALKEAEAKIARYEVRARESAHDVSVLRAKIAALEKIEIDRCHGPAEARNAMLDRHPDRQEKKE